MHAVLALRHWGFCERTERPLGAKRGGPAESQPGKQDHNHMETENFCPEKDIHSLYKKRTQC